MIGAMARREDYALLGDLQTAALVSTAGSIDWLCLPRFDSPACFAALLDTPDAGHWIVAPAAGGVCTRRRYVKDTLVLHTEWVSGDGTVRVIDFMPPRGHAPLVVRIVEGVHGSVVMRSELRLRFDYGLVVPWVRHHDDRVEAIAGPDRVRLRTPAPTRGKEMSTVSDFTVRAGDRVPFVLTWNPSHESPPKPVDAEPALRDTRRFWTDWAQRGNPVHGPYRDAIKRSLLTLKALTYQPTGGIVAAATTSLPELIGGTRNWDYRYCWLRDSTYTLQALISAGYLAEAKAWREWLLRAVAGDPAELQIMYALDGTRRIPEAELPWLAGYENSRPVRTGNAASDQLQLDVWGEILDSLALARNAGISTHDDAWDMQVALMNHLEGTWDQPDNGLWEMWACVWRSNSPNVSPGWARAVRLSGSTCIPFICERSIIKPPSHTQLPAMLCPPPRTATASSRSRAKRTLRTTSLASAHRAIRAGRLSISRFQIMRASL